MEKVFHRDLPTSRRVPLLDELLPVLTNDCESTKPADWQWLKHCDLLPCRAHAAAFRSKQLGAAEKAYPMTMAIASTRRYTKNV